MQKNIETTTFLHSEVVTEQIVLNIYCASSIVPDSMGLQRLYNYLLILLDSCFQSIVLNFAPLQ